MKKKRVLLSILLLAVVLILALIGLYFTRFQTMATIRQITQYEDGYNIYTMTVKYDYDVQNIIDSGFSDTEEYVQATVKEALPLLPVKIKLPSYGCSTYRAENAEGQAIMGRNYDFKLDTSCMIVTCIPENGYKSIACAALNNMGADDALGSMKSKMACLAAPLSCLDGVNEKGVSIAVLTLDSEPTDQRTGRERITASLAIRMVLDTCATTEEAVDLISKYDMYAVNGRDYHLFITDASGDSRVIEYDPESPERTMTATPIEAITNFYGMYIDKVVSRQKNGIYGHGKERYDYMMEIIEPNHGILTGDQAWEALKAASTEPNPESVTSNTQWSVIFNNTEPAANIVLRRHWDDIYSFPLWKAEDRSAK